VSRTLIVAHRGASAYAHENTIEAFRIAIEMSADMIETDVRKTSDGVMVLHHDEGISGCLIRELTFDSASDLALDAGYLLPTLEETLVYAAGRIKLDLEIKEAGYEAEIADMASRLMPDGGFTLTSFMEGSLKVLKEERPGIRCGLLMNISMIKRSRQSMEAVFSPLKRQARTGVDFLLPHIDLLKYGFIERVRNRTAPLFFWTVNDRQMMRDLFRDDMVGGVVTDRPDVALFFRGMIEKSRK